MGSHGSSPLGNQHQLKNWTYATAAARAAASGFTVADLGKFAYQSDDDTYWELTATTPVWRYSFGGSDVPVRGANFTVNDEDADEIVVEIQLTGPGGLDLSAFSAALPGYALTMFLSDTPEDVGVSVATTTDPDGGVNGETGAIIAYLVPDIMWIGHFTDTGYFSVNIAESGAATWYLHLILPNGKIVVSGEITFAA